jgi:hypothetical protein
MEVKKLSMVVAIVLQIDGKNARCTDLLLYSYLCAGMFGV